ncbi:hypothetical protein BISA_1396 [Bifidobacterium saguini DSM 23967]|uniref:Uncharacterized protein n=1 Tax=Bifidobacterium saguini DSM 23967 TaxID=1437607 RepID=A0A087DCI0_9BIFI|nr:hypothetical protein [Bifidobacterium saguini]KFI93230.1 hypothetical protein BISA_1396 [Bifidobacterium saguini DSM 23967]
MDKNANTLGEAIPETRCERCDQPILHEADEYECESCQSIICGDCCDECQCGDIVCETCMGHCNEYRCETLLCENCRSTCEACRATVCEDHAYRCSQCGDTLCDSCRNGCGECGTVLCDECGTYCSECEDYLCDDCRQWCGDCEEWHCDRDIESHEGQPRKTSYRNPYEGRPVGEAFTVGLEIEIDGVHDRHEIQEHHLIAAWSRDGSLHNGGSCEYQTQPMTMHDLHDITRLVETIPDHAGNAGGHMHISRTPRQTAGRWYWALKGLTDNQAASLNMRHATGCHWCHLTHLQYHGKDTAVNDDHETTIELRTFGAWNANTADQLAAAINWAHGMWRFFQKHPRGSLKTRDIMATSRTMHANATQPQPQSLTMRLADRKNRQEYERRIDAVRRAMKGNQTCAF